MCQRYVLPEQTAAEREFLPATAWWQFAPKFNVAATQYVPAIRIHDAATEGVMLRWGLIPSWVEGFPEVPANIGVASARIADSTTYREPWLNSQRCILAAAGFYTWQLTRERHRQPFFVRVAHRAVFGIAALWDRWVSDDDDVIESCGLVTVPANELMSGIGGGDRGMPAILLRRDYRTWLQGTPLEAMSVLRPYNAQWMEAHPVSPRINARDVDDPALIRIVT